MTAVLASLWMPDAATLRLLAPDFVLLGTVVALLLGAILIGRHTRAAAAIALVGALSAAGLALLSFPLVEAAGSELFDVPAAQVADGLQTPAAPGVLAADRMGMFFRLLVSLFLVAVLGMWWMFDAPRERHATEFLVLLVASALGMMLMTSAVHLLVMIIAIELASQPSYVLAGFDRWRRPAAEASLKYVIFGATTTGFSLLFGLFGTLHVPTLAERIATDGGAAGPLLTFALLALFAGVAFKISAVPFHFWCPDVFCGASLPVATWLSVASKAAGVVLLLRLVQMLIAPHADAAATLPTLLAYGLGFLGLLTCTVANLAAYGQTSVRRLLAYSSIAHAGYMLCAGAIAIPAASLSATASSAIAAYLVVYLFMNLGAFMALGLVAADTGSEDLPAFSGLGWRDPATALSLTVCLVSLIGLPPLGGFVVKWWLIYALGSAALTIPVLWIVTAGVVINTAISLYYYARIIRQMYLVGEPGAAAATTSAMPSPSAPLVAPLPGKFMLHLCAVVLLLTGTLMVPALKRGADYAADRQYAGPARLDERLARAGDPHDSSVGAGDHPTTPDGAAPLQP
mgnify:CR=1 FL=1